ncbi:MAG: hypothetical protein LBK74_08520 [Treponema sp.]|nr:hypothetical protein [Treponema sp.]
MNNRRTCGVTAVLFLTALSLFGRGKTEEEPAIPLNAEYVLLITAFDVSSLPPSQAALGSILQRELVRDLGSITYRQRSNDERFRYQELAWTAAMHEKAAELAAKREERDALLYQGVPNWKYKKELKRIEKELQTLEEEYAKVEAEKPVIDARPMFKISELNSGTAESTEAAFPPPPEPGGEEAFLRTHNADALLSGRLSLVYGRIYAEFRLFARGASFLYEDSTIFSPEDLIAAADELKLRLMAALANTEPVRLTLRVEPENARIRVNGRPVENGAELELAPGPVTISAGADNYHGIVRETELTGGETVEYTIVLEPEVMEELELVLPENASVYMGALYIGGSTEKKTEEAGTEAEAATPETAADAGAETSVPETAENAGTETAPSAETAEASAPGTPPEASTAAAGAETSVPETAAPEEAAAAAGTLEEAPAAAVSTPAGDAAEPDPPGGLADEDSPRESIIRESPDEPGVFTLYVPEGQYRYIRVDTEEGLTGEAIVLGAPREDGEVRIITLEPRKLPGRDDKPVEVKRRKFYGAYGRFWITLPIAFLLHGVFQSYNNSYYTSASPDLYDKTLNSYYISMGAWIVAGAFFAESLIRMGIYIHSASKESVPLWE